MNVTYVKTKNYEQNTWADEPIKQSQSKPISVPKTLLIVYDASKFIRRIERKKPVRRVPTSRDLLRVKEKRI